MVIGMTADGMKCVYDLPTEIKTAEQFKNLIYDYHDDYWAERTRPELFGQPRLKGLNGPMWNGWGVLKSTGETVAIIRYEKPSRY